MSKGKLRTAVLGLDERGRLLLEVASHIDYFDIQAIADKDTNLAEKLGEEYKCAAYDDYRQLVMQNQFDCLLVAAGLHTCDEHIKTAIKKKFNILKLAPAARDFEEAVELVCLADEEGVKFAVAAPSRFARSFLAFRQFLQEGKMEQPLFVTAMCTVGNQPYPPWQADPKLAGGGVLLHNCYGIIDQIVWHFGTPQQVYSLNTNIARDKQQRSYLTEDTALVTMKFTENLVGNLIASRCVGSVGEQEFIKVYGKDKILTVSNAGFSVSDCLGRADEECEYEEDERFRYTGVLENFALSIVSPDKNRLLGSGRENLKNMAVIESAYLSARTGFPEEPGRILQMARFELTNI